MFFTAANFKMVGAQAELAAKIANEIIDKQGMVLYGNLYVGRADNFTSDKKPQDTHVGIAVGLTEMGIFEPAEEELVLDKVTSDEKAAALQAELEDLKKAYNILKSTKS